MDGNEDNYILYTAVFLLCKWTCLAVTRRTVTFQEIDILVNVNHLVDSTTDGRQGYS